MRKIRILVVDDAVVVRRLVSDVLAEDAQLEVVGVAPNGRIALAKIPQLNPDLVTLDVEMPEMSGLETLAALRKDYPRMPVIMFSTLTARGAAVTLDALAMGADDYVTKPANVGSVVAAMQSVREQLIPRIKALCAKIPGIGCFTPARMPVVPPPGPRVLAAGPLRWRADVLAIGVSTGGPNALAKLLPALPRDLAVPVVIVQHMPPLFTKLLAERLAAKSAIGVSEGAPGDQLRPGHAWIAPGNHHMIVKREGEAVHVDTHQGPHENSCRPSVDVLFRSVAQVYRGASLAVVLTGMGHDGLRGSGEIRAAGGRVLVQDEATSVVWGMPGAVVSAGLADAILPLDRLAGEIGRQLELGRAARACA